jgi:four helix bundle protein
MRILRFEDLKVWQLSHRLSIDIAKLIKTFPKHEKFDLANQMRRSGRSIPSDISEGFGRFHFNDKLTFYERARASLSELRNHFHEALKNKYVNIEAFNLYLKRMNEIGFLLNRMLMKVQKVRDTYEGQKKSHSSAKP